MEIVFSVLGTAILLFVLAILILSAFNIPGKQGRYKAQNNKEKKGYSSMDMKEVTEKTQAMMDEICQYKIGDLVCLKADVELTKLHIAHVQTLNIGIQGDVITERRLQECHGGVQVHYLLQGHTGFYAELALSPLEDLATALEGIQRKDINPVEASLLAAIDQLKDITDNVKDVSATLSPGEDADAKGG